MYRYVCAESLRPIQHCWMSCSYDIVHLCVNKWLVKGEMFASNCAHELFFKNTKPFFSCRNWEALKSPEEKVGKCIHTHFILVLTSWEQFVEAKMNFRMWEACSLKFHVAFPGCGLFGIWLLGTQALSAWFACENYVFFLQGSEVVVGELAHSWLCLQSLARSLISFLVKFDITI